MTKKLFILEDDANILSSLQAKFSMVNFECKTSNGNVEIEEVINNIRAYNPDYLIIDLILPKIDGFNVIRIIKEDEILKHKPLFVFTSLSDSDSRKKSESLGVDYFFVKGEISIDDFVEKTIKIIRNKEKNK
jgi:DNA-binding response OmpR family regulator